jgi:basic membrane lipoprotein Med (substrate-binding protein (PBP1-ABC) superfamily)
MTASAARLLTTRPLRRRRADRLRRTLLVAAVAGVATLWVLAIAAAPGPGAATGASRVALVVDAGGRPRGALADARASAGAGVTVRVPRTAAEADADVRYFAAQRYGSVVAVGPLARAAARAAAPEYPRTRFAVGAAVPRDAR